MPANGLARICRVRLRYANLNEGERARATRPSALLDLGHCGLQVRGAAQHAYMAFASPRCGRVAAATGVRVGVGG